MVMFTRIIHVTACLIVSASIASASDLQKPNIVMFLADDLGYGDLGCYGSDNIRTPHLDQLSRDGMRFTDFYMPASVCSASRASLLSGCYPLRVGISGVISANARIGIHPEEELLPELLKRNGYATAIFGKWHLGNRRECWPLANGFDEWFGTIGSNDMGRGRPSLEDRRAGKAGVELVEQEEVVELNPDQSELTNRYTERAVEFIEKNKSTPFFLYLPFNMPHTPLFVSETFRGKSERGLYGDVIAEIDESVGQVLSTLDQHGLAENTIVIFTSDNGPWLIFGDHGGSAGSLSGGKKQSFDGGHRVPLIVRWPDRIPKGAVCDELVAAFDLLPTLVSCTNSESPRRMIDGKDISDIWFQRSDSASPHEFFAYFNQEELRAIRSGRWKLQLPHVDRQCPNPAAIGQGGVRGEVMDREVGLALFDLSKDPSEETDIGDQYPEVVDQLQEYAERMRQQLGDSITSSTGEARRPSRRFDKDD